MRINRIILAWISYASFEEQGPENYIPVLARYFIILFL